MLSARFPVVLTLTALLATGTRAPATQVVSVDRPSESVSARAWEGAGDAMGGPTSPTADEGTDDDAAGEDRDGEIEGAAADAEEREGGSSPDATDSGDDAATEGEGEGTDAADATTSDGAAGEGEGTDEDPDASDAGDRRSPPRDRASKAAAEGPAAPVPLPERDALGCEGDRNCRVLTVVGTVFGGVSLVAVGAGISLLVRPDRIIPDRPAYAISTKPAGMVLATLGGGALMTAVLMLVSGRKRGRSAAPERATLAGVTP